MSRSLVLSAYPGSYLEKIAYFSWMAFRLLYAFFYDNIIPHFDVTLVKMKNSMVKYLFLLLFSPFLLLSQSSQLSDKETFDSWIAELPTESIHQFVNSQKTAGSLIDVKVLSKRMNLVSITSVDKMVKEELATVLKGQPIISLYPNFKLDSRDRIPDDMSYDRQWLSLIHI